MAPPAPTVEYETETPQHETSGNGDDNGDGSGGGDNNIPAGADEPQPRPAALTFADVNGFELTIKLKRNTKLGKAMEAFAQRAEKARESLRFLFEGVRLTQDATMESMDMDDGDRVDVHHEQIGGGRVVG
ncbi:hypothetical protein B0A55_07283 [Friedmanniomyces simplex]|uniref:Ubiquitin-like domain-containing protein n=1 Tax=Friedmanniomyces simplex TaxID=329884 RepID=A0A4U0X3W6_9PEZI|nr:hypothetical protein B0A55_07283 [Friedmanniomyces simplex]